MSVSSNSFLDLLQLFEMLNSCRMRRRMVISFSCESSRPSGPCMSSFCLSPPLNVEFTNLRLVKNPTWKSEFTKGAAFLPHSHPPLIFCQIHGSKCPSSNFVFLERELQNTVDYDFKCNVARILTI